jgi:tetratricopeptide (TPR) repeat protein
VPTRNGQGGESTGGFSMSESLGNPQDWTDEQVVAHIESKQPGFHTVALLRLTNAQTEFAKARGYRHLARAQELSGDWLNAMVNWRKAFRIAWRNNFHTLTMSYLSRLAYASHKAGALDLATCYTRLLFRKAHTVEAVAYAASQLARCLYDAGDHEGVLFYASYALEHAPDGFYRTSARLRVACALNRLGRYTEAHAHALAARQEYRIQGREDGYHWASNEVARSLCGQRIYEPALQMARKTCAAMRKSNDVIALARTLLIIGTILSRQEKLARAQRTLTTAKNLLFNKHAPTEEKEVLQELAAVAARRKTA